MTHLLSVYTLNYNLLFLYNYLIEVRKTEENLQEVQMAGTIEGKKDKNKIIIEIIVAFFYAQYSFTNFLRLKLIFLFPLFKSLMVANMAR